MGGPGRPPVRRLPGVRRCDGAALRRVGHGAGRRALRQLRQHPRLSLAPEKQTARARRAVDVKRYCRGLDQRDVDGLGALVPGLGLVGDLRALGEGAVAVGVDRGVVDEKILAGLVRRDEAEALLVAEPLHGSGSHVSAFLRLSCAAYLEEAGRLTYGRCTSLPDTWPGLY